MQSPAKSRVIECGEADLSRQEWSLFDGKKNKISRLLGHVNVDGQNHRFEKKK